MTTAITTSLKKIEKLIREPTFFKVVQGGMSAGKTYAILTLLIGYAESYPLSIITVVGLTYRHLELGAIRDFTRIMKDRGIWHHESYLRGRNTYCFPNGSRIEFVSVDKLLGAHGLRRHVLFVNEANGINWDTFDQLAGRTKDFVILDYNPRAPFWVHDKLLKGAFKDDVSFLVLTFMDNEALGERERANILAHKPNARSDAWAKNWWEVYGLGKTGSVSGNIYHGWIETVKPEGAVLVRYGLDFGFARDPTALVALYQIDPDTFFVEELLYRTGMLSRDYTPEFERLGLNPNVLMAADSARPEIIAEIKNSGQRILATGKGKGSIIKGIDLIASSNILYQGENLRNEYLTYGWRKTYDGAEVSEPMDANNHLMDALRYAFLDLNRPRFAF